MGKMRRQQRAADDRAVGGRLTCLSRSDRVFSSFIRRQARAAANIPTVMHYNHGRYPYGHGIPKK